MAAWMATEFWRDWSSDLAITITPVGQGRLEIYLDDTKIFDRIEEGGKYPDLQRVRELKRVIKDKLVAVGAGR